MHKIKKGHTQENVSQHPTLPSSSSSLLTLPMGFVPRWVIRMSTRVPQRDCRRPTRAARTHYPEILELCNPGRPLGWGGCG